MLLPMLIFTASFVGFSTIQNHRVSADTKIVEPQVIRPADASKNDDQYFKQARLRIDATIAAGQNPAAIAEQYRPQAVKEPYNPKTVFPFVYAAFQAQRNDQSYRDSGRFAQAVVALGRVPPQRTYEFDRLSFLVQAEDTSGSATLKDAGLRLLKRDPNDNGVKYFVVETLEPGLHPAERRLAMQYTSQLIKASPKDAKVYALRGYVHNIAFMEKNNALDAKQAVIYYQKYLALAPQDDDFRDTAAERVQRMQNWLTQHQ